MKPTFLRLALGSALAASLGGCGAVGLQDRNPQFSDMTLDPGTMPEAARVSVPMPFPEPAAFPERAEAASLWQRGSASFFSDQRAGRVGDILTIDIQINDQAQLSNATARNREGTSTMGFPALFGYGSKIDKILPGVGPDDLPSGDIVDITSSTETGYKCHSNQSFFHFNKF